MKLLITPQALLAILVTATLSMATEPPEDDDPNATFSILPITTETQTITITATATATATGPTGPAALPPNLMPPPSGFVTIMAANKEAAPPAPTAEPTAIEKLAPRDVPAAPEQPAASEEPANFMDSELLAALQKIMALAALEEEPTTPTNPATLAARWEEDPDIEGDDDVKEKYEYDPKDPMDIPENYKFDKYGNRKKKILQKYPQDLKDPENKKGHKHPTFDNMEAPFCFRKPGSGLDGNPSPKCPNGEPAEFSWRCTVLNLPFSTELNLKDSRAERFFKCPGLVKEW